MKKTIFYSLIFMLAITLFYKQASSQSNTIPYFSNEWNFYEARDKNEIAFDKKHKNKPFIIRWYIGIIEHATQNQKNKFGAKYILTSSHLMPIIEGVIPNLVHMIFVLKDDTYIMKLQKGEHIEITAKYISTITENSQTAGIYQVITIFSEVKSIEFNKN